jgi:hypothetical protein
MPSKCHNRHGPAAGKITHAGLAPAAPEMQEFEQGFVRMIGKFFALSPMMKVVGALSAILGLAVVAFQIYDTISDRYARHAASASALKLAESELRDREYDAAWNGNVKALAAEPKSADALAQQTRIAMQWLENARASSTPGAKTFSEIAIPLEKALMEHALSAKGPALATIKAHIGWARFLRSRDGVADLHIIEEFTDALAIDPGNAYAHVMRGFFIIWKGGPVGVARPDFDAAIESGVDPDFCDRMILSALTNFHTDAHRFAAIQYANEMRERKRPIDPDSRERVLWAYEDGLGDAQYLATLVHLLPADTQIANLDWLLTGHTPERVHNDRALTAYFLESKGQTEQALAIYKDVADSAPESNARAVEFARAAIRRLTHDSSEPRPQPIDAAPTR